MNEPTKKVLTILLPIVIIVSIVVAIKKGRRPKNPTTHYSYTVYAADEAEESFYVFVFDGPGLERPVTYKGKTLYPLYGCWDCKRAFAGGAYGIPTCPFCGSDMVGGYDPERHEPVNAEKISAADLQLPAH